MFFPAPDESIWIGFLRIAVRVPGSRSLKDKRKAIAQIRDRTRAKHQLVLAEVGHLDDRARAILGGAIVGNDARNLRARLDTIANGIEQWSPALVDNRTIEIFRPSTDDGVLEEQEDTWRYDGSDG